MDIRMIICYHLLEKIKKVDRRKLTGKEHFVFFSFNGYTEKMVKPAVERKNIVLYE